MMILNTSYKTFFVAFFLSAEPNYALEENKVAKKSGTFIYNLKFNTQFCHLQ